MIYRQYFGQIASTGALPVSPSFGTVPGLAIRINSNKQKKLLHQAQELLAERFDLSVHDIADLCNISESGLRSQFKKVYGLSPKQYRMQAKINQAKYLLEATELSVYDISDRLGFYDEAYFCKMFRKYAGCSPKKYARSRIL